MNRDLYNFYNEVHTTERQSFTSSSLPCAPRWSTAVPIGRSLKESQRSFQNRRFQKWRFALSGDNPPAGKQKQPIDPTDQEKIHQYFAMPDTYENLTELQEFVNSTNVGYRGNEIWHQPRHHIFKDGVDEHGRPSLTTDQAISEKNYQLTGPNCTCRRVATITDDPGPGSGSVYRVIFLRAKSKQLLLYHKTRLLHKNLYPHNHHIGTLVCTWDLTTWLFYMPIGHVRSEHYFHVRRAGLF